MAVLLTSAGVACLGGCSDNPASIPAISGSGTIVSEERHVAPFSSVRIETLGDVILAQDSVQGVRLEADDNIMGLVATVSANGVLSIGLMQPASYSRLTLRAYVTAPDLKSLVIVGEGTYTSTSSLSLDTVSCELNGVGSFMLSGTAVVEFIHLAGRGSVNNFGLQSALCSVILSGAGSVEVDVHERLDVTMTGAGSVVYSGDPLIVNSSVTGAGTVAPRP